MIEPLMGANSREWKREFVRKITQIGADYFWDGHAGFWLSFLGDSDFTTVTLAA